MPKGMPNKRYTPEFKKLVIETMLEEKLKYCKVEPFLPQSSSIRRAEIVCPERTNASTA